MNKVVFAFCILLLFISCEKEPGEGGNSVIIGKVMMRTYTAFPTIFTETPSMEQDVYIVYGSDGTAIDDRTRTSFDGSFKFQFLKKGDYRIFVYTEDTALANFGRDKAIILQAKISSNNSEVRLPELTVVNL
jgi:hypothetical protein